MKSRKASIGLGLIAVSILSSSVSGNDTTSDVEATSNNGVFIRAGVHTTSGTLSNDYTIRDSSVGFYETGEETYDAEGNAFDVTVGYEFAKTQIKGLRVYGNYKNADETITLPDGSEGNFDGTQIGIGVEGFIGSEKVHFNYGALLSSGSSDDGTDSVDYIGIEPYVGLDGIFTGGFGYYAKVGYELRGYDEQNYTFGTTEVQMDFSATVLNAGVGLSYKF